MYNDLFNKYGANELIDILINIYESYVRSGNPRLPEFENWLLFNLNRNTLDSDYANIDEYSPQDVQLDKFRSFSKEEMLIIGPQCLSYLLQLEQNCTISPQIREQILHEAVSVGKFLGFAEFKYLVQEIILEHDEKQEVTSKDNKVVAEIQNLILH